MLTEKENSKLGDNEDLNHEGSLEEVFQFIIKKAKKALMEDGFLNPAVFLVHRDLKQNKFLVGVYPYTHQTKDHIKDYFIMIKTIINSLRHNFDRNQPLIASIFGMEAFVNSYATDEVLDKEGNFKDSFIKPSNNKDSKEVLCFQLEDENARHYVTYEFIKNDDGDIVINDKPLYDKIDGYNAEEDRLSNFAFLFVKPIKNQQLIPVNKVSF